MLNDIKILCDNEVYRIFDLMGKTIYSPLVRELMTNSKYKDTLMYKYFTLSNDIYDYQTLYNIVKENEKNLIVKPDNNKVIVHVRTGDEINNRGLNNPINREFYLEEISKHDKDVILVTALHYGHSRFNDKLYTKKKNCYTEESLIKNINVLEDFIKDIPREIEIFSSDVDTDLTYLTFADNLIVSPNAGGFAKVVKKLNDIYKNEKLER